MPEIRATLSAELHRKLKAEAANKGLHLKELVAQVLQEHSNNQGGASKKKQAKLINAFFRLTMQIKNVVQKQAKEEIHVMKHDLEPTTVIVSPDTIGMWQSHRTLKPFTNKMEVKK